MLIYAVDDEELSLKLLQNTINIAAPNEDVVAFSNPLELLEKAKEVPCDVAFLDIQMPGLTGLELAEQLNQIDGAKNIIFITSYSNYALDAFQLFASGYVTKPVQVEEVKRQLSNLRNPVTKETPHIFVQTFGNFEIYVDNVPVDFPRIKAKEILAFLVDKRGSSVTTAEIAAAIWEDDIYDQSRRKYLNVLISSMRSSLEKAGAGNVLNRSSNEISVNNSAFICDLYEFLEDTNCSKYRYTGQYMNRYSWSETTNAYLQRLIFKF